MNNFISNKNRQDGQFSKTNVTMLKYVLKKPFPGRHRAIFILNPCYRSKL